MYLKIFRHIKISRFIYTHTLRDNILKKLEVCTFNVSICTENTLFKVDSCPFFVSERALDRKHCFYQSGAELKYFICCRRARDQVARISRIQDVLQIEIFTASTKLYA